MGEEGRSVLVTGGARGIGLAAARRFLEHGDRVTIGARTEESLADARRTLGRHGHVGSVAADVSTVEGCRDTVEAALDAFGALDILFTNAGGYEAVRIEDATEESWDRTIDVHLKGTFFCIRFALEALRATKGAIVTMASDAGLSGLRGGWGAYCAAMGGVVNLTRQLALDLAPEVRVNCIAPGPVRTDHVLEVLGARSYGGHTEGEDPSASLADSLPIGRLIEPDEVADAVLFIAGASSMTGSIVSLDGGSTAGLP
jgi:NAD(P)-dependent dehydrogenase (short-subunit alcohol dehydrogenase family)